MTQGGGEALSATSTPASTASPRGIQVEEAEAEFQQLENRLADESAK